MNIQKFKEAAAEVIKEGNKFADVLDKYQELQKGISFEEFEELQKTDPELKQIGKDMITLDDRLDL